MLKNSDKSTLIPKNINRENLLEISSSLVESLYVRLNVERFKEREGDSTRLQYSRALIQAMQAHNSILKDTEIDDIKERLDILEESRHDNQCD